MSKIKNKNYYSSVDVPLTKTYYNIQNVKESTKKVQVYNPDNTYVSVQGRAFGKWIEGRGTGYSHNETITNPVYAIESIIRDEVLVERDVKISSASGYNITCTNLNNTNITDFYKDAYVISHKSPHYVGKVTSYNPSTKTITVDTFVTLTNGDYITLTNIRNYSAGSYTYNIDIASFDYLGNKFTGKLKNADITMYIADTGSARDLIQSICYQYNLMLLRGNDGTFILKSMDFLGDPVYEFNKALIIGGIPSVQGSLTPLEEVYSKLTIKYGYSNISGEYVYNKHYDSTEGNYTSLYKDCVKNYRVSSTLEAELPNVRTDEDVERFANYMSKIITKRRYIVSLTTEVRDAINVPLGSAVTVNLPDVLPDYVNQNIKFLVTSKSVSIDLVPKINWTLTEIV